MALTKRTYVDGQTIITAANLNDIQDHIITVENNYVPKTRTVAGKALSSNITLAASDVGAVPVARTVNGKALSSNITLSSADIGDDSGAGGTNVKASLAALKSSSSDLMKWENGSVSLSSGGGTLVSYNTRLLANRALKIALLEFQVNGSDGNTELTLSIPSTSTTKPIYAYNQLTNTAIKCTLENSILRIWESSTLTRASLFYYLP